VGDAVSPAPRPRDRAPPHDGETGTVTLDI
jgi:hypothetical protein